MHSIEIEPELPVLARTLGITKQRDGRTDLLLNFQLVPVELGQDEDGELISSCVVQQCVAPIELPGDNRTRYQ